MRYSLIEMVQRILESMESDEVNSIADTTESLAVANIIKECYFNLVAEHSSKNEENLFHLDAATDNTKPTLMFMPSHAADIHYLKYNIHPDNTDINLRDLKYLEMQDFLDFTNNLKASETWVGTMLIDLAGQQFKIKYRNDASPQYWTSPDDHSILLDSFDSSYEDTVTSVRTYAYGLKVPSFSMEDSFTPPLDPRQFPLLLASAKTQAFMEIKQMQNPRSERQERRYNALAYKTDDSTDLRPAIFKQQGFGRRTIRW